MNPYNYQTKDPHFNLKLKQTTPHYLRYDVNFPSAHPTPYEENNTVRGEYFKPHGNAKAPLVILLHGMGDQILIPCKMLARDLVKKGFACFVLYSVFHKSRMAEAIRERYPDMTADEWFEGYRISVIDVRQVIDWAYSREEIDNGNIAILGISFGGFISAITMGIDERIKAGILVITGGNSEKIARKSRKRSLFKNYRYTEEEYSQRQKRYEDYLCKIEDKGFDSVTPNEREYLIDPYTFARNIQGRPLLMINSLWDEYIPKETTIDLWKACGKPAIKWFPSTHPTIWLWYLLISKNITAFLSATFGGDNAKRI